MPLTGKGTEIKSAMEQEYGSKKGEQVFYASKNAGKISGVDSARGDAVSRLDASISAMCDACGISDDRRVPSGVGSRFDAEVTVEIGRNSSSKRL